MWLLERYLIDYIDYIDNPLAHFHIQVLFSCI